MSAHSKAALRTKTYGALTPARDEEEFLPGLIESMAAQTSRPRRWIIIDDGSTDATPALLDEAARNHQWISVHHVRRAGGREPGGETAVQRFLAPGLWKDCDLIFRVDADITFAPDFVRLLLEEFDRDPYLGIGSGTLYELRRNGWREMRTPRKPSLWTTLQSQRAALGSRLATIRWEVERMRSWVAKRPAPGRGGSPDHVR